MSIKTEPVATAGAATALATVIVIVGNATKLWHMDDSTAASIAAGIVGAVGVVGSLLARRKVTPVATKLPAGTPHTPGA